MRAAIAGPLTAVGGFHKKAAVFRPSPELKLFGKGNGLVSAPTAASRVRPPMLFRLVVTERMSYVRIQRIPVVGVGQRGTSSAPVLESTSSGLLRVIVVPLMTSGLAGSGTK